MKRLRLRWPAIAAPRPNVPLQPFWIRLFWMTGIWAASITVLLLVAKVLHLVLRQ